MQSVYQLIFTHVWLFIVIFGLTLNGFIVLMNGKTWIRNKCLLPGDKIVTSLCLSRWIFQCVVVVHWTFPLSLISVHLAYFNYFFSLARLLLNCISIWFASLLCVYYCVKIANYKHVVFLYLKVRMSRSMPWCLGLCIFFPFAFILPFFCKYLFSQYKPVTADVFQNLTEKTFEEHYIYFIGSSPPLVIFTIAFFLTIPSLWRHIRNMSGVGTGFRNPDMQTHYNAIKSMTAFFLLHILFVATVYIYLCGVLSTYKVLMAAVTALYPCLHSGVIIFYNRKLRKGLLFTLTYVLSYVQKKAVTD